jgi:serine/threonine protein kinase
MSSAGTDLSGTTLDGRYMLVRRLGEGAMGTVYVASHHTLGQPVAVKLLHPWLAAEAKHRERFMREARAASRLEHPNVVELIEVGTTPEGAAYLVMELLQGNDLRAILRRDGPLRWGRARHFLLQATAALREAHRHGVIHRDIKPANCFVCDATDGRPERMKLLDFGIAKLGEDASSSHSGDPGKRLTQTGELVGTLAYLAPEFAEGRPASVFTDMYALGIMAYELLTGDVPFRGKNEFQVLARHLSEPPVRPRVLVPSLPESAEALVLTLLAKKPELRFESMEDVEQALLAIPPDARSDGPPTGPLPQRTREGSGPAVVRRREGSGPRRESSGPQREDGSPRQGPRAREGSGPQREGSGPKREGSGPPREHGAPRREGARREGSGPSTDVWSLIGEPQLADSEPVRPPSMRRRSESEVASTSTMSSGMMRVRRWEWGTIATVVLLLLLLGAGIASVVLRQQGIELRWPWSPQSEAPEGDSSPRE